MSRDELVMDCLRYATKMLQRLACDWKVDFEDLYQEAALTVLTMWQEGDFNEPHPPAYAKRAIRFDLIDMYIDQPTARKFRTSVSASVSLDAPISAENDAPLFELIPESSPVEDGTRQDWLAQALYEALWKLPLEEQAYLREVYQLNAFLPRWMDRSRKPDYSRARGNICHTAFNRLRRDKELAAAILN